MNELNLRLKSGARLVVPASLGSLTTYILLEQEEWFEKEVGFLLQWLQPGMTAVDVGANLGVYAVPMARRVGPHGHVFAYEPGSQPRAMLERSREINRADNLHVVGAALSDGPREGHLVLGASSELNSLAGSGPGEAVRITSLDEEDRIRGWSAVDFVKIDAEGEEERILAGATAFFERHSPLVMFEIRSEATTASPALRFGFPQRGYNIYRALAGAPVLVRVLPDEEPDRVELNLLAAKPDRAAALARDGLLVDQVTDWTPDAGARDRALEVIAAQAFWPDFVPLFSTIDADYRDGLAGYAAWRSPDLSLADRCGALEFACRTLLAACEKAPTLARFSSLARASWDAGKRSLCIAALRGFADFVVRGAMDVGEPFWPASERFDCIAPGAKRAEWLLTAAFEQLERAAAFSSIFSPPSCDPDWLCAQPFAGTEMERRRILRHAVSGQSVEVPPRLCVAAADHLNADVWRAGLVPNTSIRVQSQAG